MNCPRCQSENEISASFCRNCGYNLQPNFRNQQLPQNQTSDILVFVALVLFFIMHLYWFIIPKVVDEWWIKLKYLNFSWNMLYPIVLLLLAISVKNKSFKIISIILAILYTGLAWFDTIKGILH